VTQYRMPLNIDEATLNKLLMDMPAIDLDMNLRAGDKRFIGINGIVCGASTYRRDGDVPYMR
jgi:hypothetical protein